MADFWDGMTIADWNDYMNCTCAGGTDCTRSSGEFRFGNTYGSQWTGPNFDNSARRPGLESSKTYVFEIRFRPKDPIQTTFYVTLRYTDWAHPPIVVTELETYTNPNTGQLDWRDAEDTNAAIVSTNGTIIAKSSTATSDYNYNDGTYDWIWKKFKVQTPASLTTAIDLRISLGYGSCWCADTQGGSSWVDVTGAGSWTNCNQQCSSQASTDCTESGCPPFVNANNNITYSGGEKLRNAQNTGWAHYSCSTAWGNIGNRENYCCCGDGEALVYETCTEAEHGGTCSGGWGCNGGCGANSCNPACNTQVSHGYQSMRIDKLNFTDVAAIGGWDANFSRNNFGYFQQNGSGNTTLDATYVNYAVGRRGVRFNTKGDQWNNGVNPQNDNLRRVLMEMEGIGAPLPPHNNAPVQGVLALKPRQDLLYNDPTLPDTTPDDNEYGVNDDPMIIDAPTLIYDNNNYLRGWAIMLHAWNYMIAHRWRVEWKLYLPVNYIIAWNLQDKYLTETRYGMQLTGGTGTGVVFDSRLEGLQPIRGSAVLYNFHCCTAGNCTSGTTGNLYEWNTGAVGHCDGSWYLDQDDGYNNSSFREDYDSHPFYISNSVSANTVVKDREDFLLQGVGTPESMYRLSAEAGDYGGSAMWGCAFKNADAGFYNQFDANWGGCGANGFSSCSYSLIPGALSSNEMCQLNLYGIGAPFQSPGYANADSNANQYRVMANTIFVMGDYDILESYQHAAEPTKEDSKSLDEALERYQQMIRGNGWEMDGYDWSTNLNTNCKLYFKDIDGGYSTSPYNVDYSHNPDANNSGNGNGNPAGLSLGGMLGNEYKFSTSTWVDTEWGYNYKATTRHNFQSGVSITSGLGTEGYQCSGGDCSSDHKVCSGVIDSNAATSCLVNYTAEFGNEQNAWDMLCCEQSCSQSCTPGGANAYSNKFTYNIWAKSHAKNPPRYWLINVSRDEADATGYEARALCQASNRSWEWCWVGRANINVYGQSGPG